MLLSLEGLVRHKLHDQRQDNSLLQILSSGNVTSGRGEQKRTETVPMHQGAEQTCLGTPTPAKIPAVLSGETAAVQ